MGTVNGEKVWYRVEATCRSCHSENKQPVAGYGITPLADRLIRADQLGSSELLAPLTLQFCGDCGLLQIAETVDPKIMFSEEYPYFSSVSESLVAHFRESAERLIVSQDLDPGSLVVEAASNDGYMLQWFVRKGIPVLGVDPAQAPAIKAIERGVNTHTGFFDLEFARGLEAAGRHADLFLANNVLAHVQDINDFVQAIAVVLKENGLAVIEVQYALDLVDRCGFDMVYHQHACYFTVTALDNLLRRHGLFVTDVERVATQGGSLRLFVSKQERPSKSVSALLQLERRLGANTYNFFQGLGDRMNEISHSLFELISNLKGQGYRIAGYGAAAKAATMLSVCRLGGELLDYVVDLNTFKQGRYMGGNHLPIRSPAVLTTAEAPDYLLLLAWNLADEIMAQQSEFRRGGGKFILPVPTPKIL